MKTKAHDQRTTAGHSWVSNLLWFLAAILIIMASMRMVNPKLHEYYIEKKIEDIGRFEGSHMQPEEIQQAVFTYAKNENIPLKLEDIIVTKASGMVTVHITYEESIDLVVVKWPYKVDMSKASNRY